jgi:hypothetical protein
VAGKDTSRHRLTKHKRRAPAGPHAARNGHHCRVPQDLGAARSVGGHRLARPETIWFALWDGRRNLRAAPYLLTSWWPADRRIRQFRGSHWQRHGRFRLDIDRDEVFGAVY